MRSKDHLNNQKRIASSELEIARWHSNRKKLTDYVDFYSNKSDKNRIDKDEHEAMVNMALQGKSLAYWNSVIDAKIAKEERIVTDAKNKIRDEKNRKIRSISVLAIAFALFAGLILFMRPQFTGYAVMDNDTVVNDVSELFYEDAVYSITSEHNITSLLVSGKIIGNGTVRIYLGERLVLDSLDLRDKKSGLSAITGLAIDDIGMDSTEPVNETAAEEIEPEEENFTDTALVEDDIVEESVPEDLHLELSNETKIEPAFEEEIIQNQTDEMIPETNDSIEDITDNLENNTIVLNETIELNESVNESIVNEDERDSSGKETTIEIPEPIENLTQENLELNVTLVIPENVTEEIFINQTEVNKTIIIPEIDLSSEIDFKNICIDTCVLDNHAGELELRIEIDGAKLYLSSATYSIVKEEPIVEEIVEQNVSAEEFISGIVEIGKPVVWETTVNASEIDAIEVSAYAYDLSIESEDEEDISDETAALVDEFSVGKEYFDLEKQVKELEKPVDKDKVKNNIAQLMEVNSNLAKADEKLKEKVDLDKETVKLELRNLKDNVRIMYTTPGPEKTEKTVNEYKKNVTVSSPLHYENVLTYTDIAESKKEAIRVYWVKDTGKELFNDVNYIDADGNGLIDKLEWIIPHLSNQTFEISINVLNPYEYLRDGETWVVAFNTTGIGNLSISSPNAGWTDFLADNTETFDEMMLLNLSCGNSVLLTELKLIGFDNNTYDYSSLSQNDSIDIRELLVENYECNSTGYLSNYMLKAGYATILFEFSNQNASVSDYAYDPTTTYTLYSYLDDGHEYPQDTWHSGSNWFGHYTLDDEWMVLRFQNINVPKGAVINSALLNVTAQGGEGGSYSVYVKVKAHASDSSAQPSASNLPSYWTLTSSGTDFDIDYPGEWSLGQTHTINITNVIQEIIDRSSWSSGNNISIVFENDGSTGGNDLEIDDYDDTYPATLDIDYTNNSAPTWVNDPVISPASPTSSNNLTCNFNVTDTNGDAVVNITNWYKNNESITVLYMPFEGNGNEANNATDYSGYGNNGTVVGATWNRTGGKIGGAYDFDGDSGYIEIPESSYITSNNSNFSIESWFYANEWTSNSVSSLISKRNAKATMDWALYYYTAVTELRFVIGEDAAVSLFSALNLNPTIQEWHHLVITRNDSTYRLYFEGTLNGTDTSAQTWVDSENIVIGNLQPNDVYVINGTLDEVKIYNYSLSPEQIWANYEAGLAGKSAKTIVFNETTTGDEWLCSVTPNDGYQDGLTKNSTAVTIVSNNVPTWVDDPEIYPYTPLSSQNLTCNFNVTDVNGDSITNITNWYKDNKSITVLYMPFEGGSNSTYTKDYSGYGNDGTVTSATWNQTGGKIGGAYAFDGNADYIDIGSSSYLNPVNELTVEVWVKMNSPSGSDDYPDVVHGEVYAIELQESSTDFRFGFNNNTGQYSSTTFSNWQNLEIDTWYHLVVTYNSSEKVMKTYQNGVLNYTKSASGTFATSSDPRYIGAEDPGWSYFNGTIDEVKIYNYTLSPEQIWVDYQAGLSGHSPTILISNETSLNDEWLCSVTPNDGYADGLTKNSTAVTIDSNNVPTWVDDPVITPASPLTTQNLTCN
ncbi:MAG: hypothetical protein KKF44_03705, partial [Nanoarchaeota archaeon]|nr:hypothetical protein [Nanoarchaeota archaeon]